MHAKNSYKQTFSYRQDKFSMNSLVYVYSPIFRLFTTYLSTLIILRIRILSLLHTAKRRSTNAVLQPRGQWEMLAILEAAETYCINLHTCHPSFTSPVIGDYYYVIVNVTLASRKVLVKFS